VTAPTGGAGLLIAAPSSGAGKTTVTLGLLRALVRRGVAVRGAKSGPDYIDPGFHAAACGADCMNLDAWAMPPDRLRMLAAGPGLMVVEGAMGLFDGAPPDGRGASADLARILGLPVVLVIDAARMAQSVAPLVAGFAGHDSRVRIAGVILNRVGSARHEAMLRRALAPSALPVLAALPRDVAIATPDRHLGLVQAAERPDLEPFLDRAAAMLERHGDVPAIAALAAPLPDAAETRPPPPPAQTIAVARDAAFGFAYPHQMAAWRAAGGELRVFSPLADDPVPAAEFVYLPGGYPELHAGRLAAAKRFLSSLRRAAGAGSRIYGECGGYMVLGQGLTDAEGQRHAMAGLLPLESSFRAPQRHLGYRRAVLAAAGPLGAAGAAFRGHEFHYARVVGEEGPAEAALFSVAAADGSRQGSAGQRRGGVFGSFLHLIDRETP